LGRDELREISQAYKGFCGLIDSALAGKGEVGEPKVLRFDGRLWCRRRLFSHAGVVVGAEYAPCLPGCDKIEHGRVAHALAGKEK
jgi:hypothetical protein